MNLTPEESGIAEIKEMQKPERPPLSSYRVNHLDTIGLSWQEIEMLRPPAVVDYFGRRGELLLIAAESKSRKSWLVQDLGFCVALGVPWLRDENGQGGFATKKAKVHVFDLELDSSEIRYRVAKARSNMNADREAQTALTNSLIHYSLDGVSSLDVMTYLADLQATVMEGDLVILDCLYRLQADGNETDLIANIMTALKQFAKQTKSLVVLVDHFRKAGAEKSRDRIAGTFVKSASASTVVAIEVNSDKILKMHIDARTFHGCDRVTARFDFDSYRFIAEGEDYATDDTTNECLRWIVALWLSHDQTAPITLRSAIAKWGGTLSRPGADKRLSKLEKMHWIVAQNEGSGKTKQWYLTAVGLEKIRGATKPVAGLSLHNELALGESSKNQPATELHPHSTLP